MKKTNKKYAMGMIAVMLLAASCAEKKAPIVKIGEGTSVPISASCNPVGIWGPAVFSFNGKYVATQCSSADIGRYTIDVWDLQNSTGTALFSMSKLEGKDDPAYSIAFSPEGNELLVGTTKGPRLFSIPKGEAIEFLPNSYFKNEPTQSVAYSPSGDLVALFQKDTIRVVHRFQQKQLAILQYADSSKPIRNLTFSSDGNHLLATVYTLYNENDKKETLLSWNLKQFGAFHQVSYEKKMTYPWDSTPGFLPFQDGYLVVSLGYDEMKKMYQFNLWNGTGNEAIDSPSGDQILEKPIVLQPLVASSMSISSSGRYIAVGYSGSAVPDTQSRPSVVFADPFTTELVPIDTSVAKDDTVRSKMLGVFIHPEENRLFAVTEGRIYQWPLLTN